MSKKREHQDAAPHVSRLSIDEASGLPHGYAGQLLGPNKAKGLGKISMGALLGALALRFVVEEDPEQLERIASKLTKRGAMPAPGTVHWRLRKKNASDDMLPIKMPKPSRRGSAWARQMNARRASRLSRSERSMIARGGAGEVGSNESSRTLRLISSGVPRPKFSAGVAHHHVLFGVRQDRLKADMPADDRSQLTLPFVRACRVVAERPVMSPARGHQNNCKIDIAIWAGVALRATSEQPNLSNAIRSKGPLLDTLNPSFGHIHSPALLSRYYTRLMDAWAEFCAKPAAAGGRLA